MLLCILQKLYYLFSPQNEEGIDWTVMLEQVTMLQFSYQENLMSMNIHRESWRFHSD